MAAFFFSLFICYFVGGLFFSLESVSLFQQFLLLCFVFFFVFFFLKKMALFFLIGTMVFPYFSGFLLGKSLSIQTRNLEKLSSQIQTEDLLLLRGKISKLFCKDNISVVTMKIKNILLKEKSKKISYRGIGIKFETDVLQTKDLMVGDHISVLFRPQKRKKKFEEYYHYLIKAKKIVLYSKDVLSIKKRVKGKDWIQKSIVLFRKKCFSSLNQYENVLGSDVIQLLAAWILGMREGVSSYYKKLFKNSGTYHIFAISGFHVMIFYFLFFYFFTLFPFFYRIFFIVLCLFFSFFVLLMGHTSSVVRATLMLILKNFFQNFGRSMKREVIFFLVLLIGIIFVPYKVYDVGFQMSFLSITIILIYLNINKYYFKCYDSSFFTCLIKPFVFPLFLFFGMIPMNACFFGKISLLGVVANIVIIPLTVFAIYGALFLLIMTLFQSIFFIKYLIDHFILPIEKLIMETILSFIDFIGFYGSLDLHWEKQFAFFYFMILLFFLFLQSASQKN